MALIHEFVKTGLLRARWLTADEFEFKTERRKIAFLAVKYGLSFASAAVTVVGFLIGADVGGFGTVIRNALGLG